MARHGSARQGKDSFQSGGGIRVIGAGLGVAGRGVARRCEARQGKGFLIWWRIPRIVQGLAWFDMEVWGKAR